MKKLLKKMVPERVKPLLRALLFKAQNRGFVPYVDEVEKEGLRFKFYVGDRVGESWHRGGWDWTEIRFLREHVVATGDVVLECGAHHGELTIFLSNWVGPQGKVVTFEPVPRNAHIIRQNIDLNGLDNVTLENKAVGSSEGMVVITDESNAQVTRGAGAGIEIPSTTLDAYAHLKPTLLKIDVEGFEGEVLKAARSVLATRPKLALEIHALSLPRYQSSVEEIFSLLDLDGYRLWLQYSDEDEVHPYEGAPITRTAHLFAVPE